MTTARKDRSPYEKAMQKDADKKRDRAEARGKCGAKKRNGQRCAQPKGFGTTHYGIGRCKFHGGSLPTHRKKAAKDIAILMGAPVDINALDALIWCIKLTAGEVEFCSQQMEMLDKADWFEETIIGKQLHMWAKERQRAVDRLAKFSKDAIGLGIAERAVRVAEMYGQSIAKYTKGLLDDLELSTIQKEKAPLIIRKHLALLEGGAPISDEDRRKLPAIPRRVQSGS